MSARRPAAFLDRDGTIVEERDYLSDPEGVRLLPGAAAGLRRMAAAGYALVVVTNQSGVARGLFGEEELAAVQRRVEELLAEEDVRLDGVYHCPHHPDFTGDCSCRKPAPGLVVRAAADLGLALDRSFLIGDRLRDVVLDEPVGARPILVRTGYGEAEAARAPGEVSVVDDLCAAAEMMGVASAP